MQNTGTIRWKHVTLVHQSGFAPIEPIIAVPDLAPGEQTELVASYPTISLEDSGSTIHSVWKLCYKGKPCGTSMWLSVNVRLSESDNVHVFITLYIFLSLQIFLKNLQNFTAALTVLSSNNINCHILKLILINMLDL